MTNLLCLHTKRRRFHLLGIKITGASNVDQGHSAYLKNMTSTITMQGVTLALINAAEKITLSYDITSGSEIRPCNKIDKPLVVYRSSENVMTSITMLRT